MISIIGDLKEISCRGALEHVPPDLKRFPEQFFRVRRTDETLAGPVRLSINAPIRKRRTGLPVFFRYATGAKKAGDGRRLYRFWNHERKITTCDNYNCARLFVLFN